MTRREPILLVTELAAAECERRLDALPKDSTLGAFAKGVVCSTSNGLFQLRIEHGGRMPRRVFRGRCVPDGSGSRIVGRFRWSRGDRVMTIIGVAMITAIAANDTWYGVARDSVAMDVVWGLIIALGVVALRRGGAHDEARLMDFLRVELKSRAEGGA